MINVFKPSVSLADIFSVIRSLFSNNISGTSPVVNEFEKELSKKFNRNYVTAVSNGSVALDLALQLLDLDEEDEVILPSFAIISCLSAILRSGAKPIFCDVNKDSWNMTLDEVEKSFTKRTKAVLMVHLYGLTAEAEKIAEFCNSKNITLIEDAAEAHGQNVNGKLCGSFGDVSTFSFYANKHITTGEGGAVLTDNQLYDEKLKRMRNLDFTKEQRFNHNNFFWNYRISGLQAALGLSQIKKLEKTVKNKIKQGAYYDDLLSKFENYVQIPLKELNGSQNHYWVYGIVIKKNNIRDNLMNDLIDHGIETRPFFWPLHLQNALSAKHKADQRSLSVSEDIGMNGLYIPLGQHVTKKKQEYIVEKLIESIKRY